MKYLIMMFGDQGTIDDPVDGVDPVDDRVHDGPRPGTTGVRRVRRRAGSSTRRGAVDNRVRFAERRAGRDRRPVRGGEGVARRVPDRRRAEDGVLGDRTRGSSRSSEGPIEVRRSPTPHPSSESEHRPPHRDQKENVMPKISNRSCGSTTRPGRPPSSTCPLFNARPGSCRRVRDPRGSPATRRADPASPVLAMTVRSASRGSGPLLAERRPAPRVHGGGLVLRGLRDAGGGRRALVLAVRGAARRARAAG